MLSEECSCSFKIKSFLEHSGMDRGGGAPPLPVCREVAQVVHRSRTELVMKLKQKKKCREGCESGRADKGTRLHLCVSLSVSV